MSMENILSKEDQSPWHNERSITEELRKYNPEFPEIELCFYFGAHRSESDVNDFSHLLVDADIFIPEVANHTLEIREEFQAISNGEISKEEFIEKIHGIGSSAEMFFTGLVNLVYNKNKIIDFIDVPLNSPVIKKIGEHIGTFDGDFPDMNIDQAKHYVLDWFTKFRTLQAEREQYMIQQLPKVLIRATKESPQLLKSNSIKVLVFLGSAHKVVYRQLKHIDKKISFEEGESKSAYSEKLNDLLIKKKQVGESLLLRVVIECILFGEVLNHEITKGMSGVELYKLIRKLIADISDIELETIYDRRKEGVLAVMKELYTERGDTFPETKEQALNFLGVV